MMTRLRAAWNSRRILSSISRGCELIAANVNPLVQREIAVAEASKISSAPYGDAHPDIAVRCDQKSSSGRRCCFSTRTRPSGAGYSKAMDDIKQGAGAEKTLVGTIINLDRGRTVVKLLVEPQGEATQFTANVDCPVCHTEPRRRLCIVRFPAGCGACRGGRYAGVCRGGDACDHRRHARVPS